MCFYAQLGRVDKLCIDLQVDMTTKRRSVLSLENYRVVTLK